MSTHRWEYKVAFVEGWRRVSVEGAETYPEYGERHSAFGRRFLNEMGADGWELAGIQHAMPGRSYYIFRRPLAEGTEPDLSVVRRGQRHGSQPQQSSQGESGAQATSV